MTRIEKAGRGMIACGFAGVASAAAVIPAVAMLLGATLVAPAAARDLSLAGLGLRIDLSQTTVSGVSSGAYMAGQFQIAHSGMVRAAGLIAGGPYDCAEVSTGGIAPVVVAQYRCMATAMGGPDVASLVASARSRAAAGEIDPLSNLARSRIYLFTGANDVVVTRPVVDAAAAFYRALGVPDADLHYVRHPEAAHAQITDGYGAPCGFIPREGAGSDYINDCRYDQAGAILAVFYDGARRPNAPDAARRPLSFDQRPFIGDPSRSGMAKSGYVYVPEACEGGRQTCRIHVAFHGCRMASSIIGDRYAVHAGYNRWADVNGIVVLYPQIDGDAKPGSNPRACWDWFGYTGYDFARRSGIQMTAVRRMIGALAGE
ncbi:extracellular catalytic domain type 2 short-chain-length polyhydroxyalkanoate depolymerase [Azospirillum picis]|uniref:Poly(3-hydroxybutyrate) depolymerase n=1 Tax=Azospirillum picis TaxID=488438 RepID=A0ABU0MTD9_9PROT|nr:plasmid partitioning protein [Azospirillum picis]MBP2302970.1 poly(3-hydroxybutyrate) depolymerase [Azospirillum picis]MDQ0536722.1 poly(3-hydroxybutyrate) depolymerase [Azospirillum picis]